MNKQLLVGFGALVVLGAIVYLIIRARTGDPRIVKHQGTEIIDTGKLRSISLSQGGEVLVQFPGVWISP
jgi:hypothetical protein